MQKSESIEDQEDDEEDDKDLLGLDIDSEQEHNKT